MLSYFNHQFISPFTVELPNFFSFSEVPDNFEVNDNNQKNNQIMVELLWWSYMII